MKKYKDGHSIQIHVSNAILKKELNGNERLIERILKNNVQKFTDHNYRPNEEHLHRDSFTTSIRNENDTINS